MDLFSYLKAVHYRIMDELFKTAVTSPYGNYVAYCQRRRKSAHFHARRRNARR
jgi:hypothetical protein